MKYNYLKQLLNARTLHQKVRTYGDGDGEGEGGAGGDSPVKTFTQEEVNSLISGEKNKLKTKLTELQNQLQQFKQGGLSPDDRKKLEDQLEATRKTFLTKEQQVKEQAKAKERELTDRLTALEAEAKRWRDSYSNEVIGSSLLKAATSVKDTPPPNPDLIVDLLRSKTTLEELVGSDGSPTGEFAPKVAYQTVNEKGESLTLSLDPVEAVKRMAADTARYGALFGSNQRGGFNSSQHSRQVVTDAASYAELRKTGAHRQIGV